MKLPNGYGSVTKLSGKRRKPYIVRKTTGWHYDKDKDKQVQDSVVIGYAATKKEGLAMLAEYNSDPYDIPTRDITFSELWERFEDYKFKDDNLSTSTHNSYIAAYKHCEVLYNKVFSSLKRTDLQYVINNCGCARATQDNIVILFRQMYKYAAMEDICTKDYSRYISAGGEKNERGTPFTMDAIKKLWREKDNPCVQIILMMIYSGVRIKELTLVDIDLHNKTIYGGIKTEASKNRYAPIHDATFPFWEKFDQEAFRPFYFRRDIFYPILENLDILYENGPKHTPHDCRHTFSWLADYYNVDDTSKHLLMGHKLKGDTEQVTYRHRTLDELRTELNKIEIPL